MEIWKPVVGYESFYSVSNLGNIRRDFDARGTKKGNIFISISKSSEYRIITLRINGINKSFTVHSLVANAFIGQRPKGFEINHKDGDKWNNCIFNIEYVTPSENRQHAIKMGTKYGRIGEKNSNSRVSIRDVHTIRRMYQSNKCTQKYLSASFNISEAQIHNIIHKKSWKHI